MMTRKMIGALLLAAGLVCFFAAVLNAGESSSASLDYRTKVHVEYPLTGQAKADRIIQDWVEDSLNRTLRDNAGVALDPAHPESEDTVSVSYREKRPSDRVVGYVFETYVYPWRAAHPMSYVDVLLIDLDRHKRLGLADIFARPDRALTVFSEKAPEAVRRDLADQVPEGVPEDALFMDGFKPVEENYRNVGIEPGGVRVYFQLYQVLPYVFGKPEAFVSLDELKEAGPRLELWGQQP